MFEISLTNNPKSDFIIAPTQRSDFNPDLHRAYSYNDEFLSVSALGYRTDTDDLFQNSSYLVIISGSIFPKGDGRETLKPLSAKDILLLHRKNPKHFVRTLKGNFLIFIYNIKQQSFCILKDPLGLKYLYYSTERQYFHISTNLNDFKTLNPETDKTTILETLLFTYPINNNTYYRNVRFLDNGQAFTYSNERSGIREHYDITRLFPDKLGKFDSEKFIALFEHAVVQRASTDACCNVSLTGGFDGRAVVSVLLNRSIPFNAYSFGKKGGENTLIPTRLADKLNISYSPIYLDKEYEASYRECARKAVELSDGISKFERANYIFALRKISLQSPRNLTGLLGGEVLGAVHLKTDYINGTYFDIIYQNLNTDYRHILEQKGLGKFIRYDYFSDNNWQELQNRIEQRRARVNAFRKSPHPYTYYIKDFITLGFVKFYGNQMHLERYYCENLTPFYDYDLLEYLFSTDYIRIYRNAFKSSPLNRRKNRLLQTAVINRFSKALSEYPVDRGYPPSYNYSWRKLLIPYYYLKRRNKRDKQPPDFTTPIWSDIFYRNIPPEYLENSLFLQKEELIGYIRNYRPENYRSEVNRALSILLFLSEK